MCNNPFYTLNVSKKIVAPNDINRTSFGNYAFCGITVTDENVLDGCAGPHTGTESRKEYLDNSIDRAMGEYGDISNIKVFNAVGNVE